MLEWGCSCIIMMLMYYSIQTDPHLIPSQFHFIFDVSITSECACFKYLLYSFDLQFMIKVFTYSGIICSDCCHCKLIIYHFNRQLESTTCIIKSPIISPSEMAGASNCM